MLIRLETKGIDKLLNMQEQVYANTNKNKMHLYVSILSWKQSKRHSNESKTKATLMKGKRC